MGRREGKAPRRDRAPQGGRKGGSLFAGLMIGLTLGVGLAAGLAWYLNMSPTATKVVESVPEAPGPRHPQRTPDDGSGVEQPLPKAAPVAKAEPRPDPPPPLPAPKTESSGAPAPKPRVNYTFYGILPGDKPARPVEPTDSKDTWWLQIAALSDAKKADQIRARLVLLNLRASTQKIESNGQPLYRIRVGPYKREDDAFGDLDILTENDFNARLIKDPAKPN